MKKTLLSLVLIIAVTFTASAQTDKGWRSVGGTGRLTLDFKNKTHYFDLSPEIYWFVANSFALGTDFGVGFYSSKTSDTVSSSEVSAFATLGARYYFSNTDHKWRPYAFGNAGYEVIAAHMKVGSTKTNSTDNGFRGYAGLGLAWFFSDHAAFDTRLHVIDYTRNDVYFNPSFSIGIQAFFD